MEDGSEALPSEQLSKSGDPGGWANARVGFCPQACHMQCGACDTPCMYATSDATALDHSFKERMDAEVLARQTTPSSPNWWPGVGLYTVENREELGGAVNLTELMRDEAAMMDEALDRRSKGKSSPPFPARLQLGVAPAGR